MAAQTSNGQLLRSTPAPRLSAQQWNLVALVGIILIVMAILQLISFNSFKDWLGAIGLKSPATWGVGVIIAELFGAAGFFKLRLTYLVRLLSASLALLVGLFWFVESLQVVTSATAHNLTSSGFFGKYLHQTPGWWTVIEATVLLFWIVYALELSKEDLMLPKDRS